MTESRKASANSASSGGSVNGDVLRFTGPTGAPRVDERAELDLYAAGFCSCGSYVLDA